MLKVNLANIIGNPEDVQSLYIFADLQEKDYEIIGQMVNLEALYMYKAKKLEDISFLENLTKLKELMIHNSKIKDLSPIAKVRKKQEVLYPKVPWCKLQLVAILKSKVSDLAVFDDKIRFSELKVKCRKMIRFIGG